MGHARALLELTQRRHQIEVGTLVAKKGLSVRETEALVRSMLAKARRRQQRREGVKALDPNVQRLQDELSEKLGAPVQIQHTGSGKGKVVVSYHSLDELDGILRAHSLVRSPALRWRCCGGCAAHPEAGRVLFEDDFTHGLGNWHSRSGASPAASQPPQRRARHRYARRRHAVVQAAPRRSDR